MSADGWTFADLEPEQLALVNEAERTLHTAVVMAYAPSPWGTVDPDTIADGMHPVELETSELEYLQGLETKVGGVLVAYRRDVD